jgi:hypothetical protein
LLRDRGHALAARQAGTGIAEPTAAIRAPVLHCAAGPNSRL